MLIRDRVEYEEWLLKALDASAAPKLLTRRPKPDNSTNDNAETGKVPLYYPSSFMTDQEAVQDLRQMLDHREPHHQDLMKKSLYIARMYCFGSLYIHEHTDECAEMLSLDLSLRHHTRSPQFR